jgi:hypothetical protein
LVEAAAIASGVVRVRSYVTVAVFFLKSTSTLRTPGTLDIAAFTVIGQVAHVMLSTANVAVARLCASLVAGSGEDAKLCIVAMNPPAAMSALAARISDPGLMRFKSSQ